MLERLHLHGHRGERVWSESCCSRFWDRYKNLSGWSKNEIWGMSDRLHSNEIKRRGISSQVLSLRTENTFNEVPYQHEMRRVLLTQLYWLKCRLEIHRKVIKVINFHPVLFLSPSSPRYMRLSIPFCGRCSRNDRCAFQWNSSETSPWISTTTEFAC